MEIVILGPDKKTEEAVKKFLKKGSAPSAKPGGGRDG